jgi:hypothetical protein
MPLCNFLNPFYFALNFILVYWPRYNLQGNNTLN